MFSNDLHLTPYTDFNAQSNKIHKLMPHPAAFKKQSSFEVSKGLLSEEHCIYPHYHCRYHSSCNFLTQTLGTLHHEMSDICVYAFMCNIKKTM